jgi:pyrroloquinoline quinone biosynthesis protein B
MSASSESPKMADSPSPDALAPTAPTQHFRRVLPIIDPATREYWLIDAPPQLEQAIRPLTHLSLKGIFLTPAHIGHYTGLIFLGKEALNTQNLPVYCSPRMDFFLHQNQPWAALIQNQNIVTHQILSHDSTFLSSKLTVAQIAVPHRPDFTDTFAYFVIGPKKSLFYCPDIDYWPVNNPSFQAICDLNEYLLLDATFYSPEELPGRDLTKIPHPFVTDTVKQLRDYSKKTTLIHFNHSNPLLNPDSQETQKTLSQGFQIAQLGDTFPLD